MTLKADGASVASIAQSERTASAVNYSYSGSDSTSTLPAGLLSLDIPGAPGGFPSTLNVALPSLPESFSLGSPALDSNGRRPVTRDTAFAWSGGLGGQNAVFVLFGVTTADASGRYFYFTCYAKDDGAFALTSATRPALDAIGFSGGFLLAASRLVTRVETRGDAALGLAIFRSEAYRYPSDAPATAQPTLFAR